MRVVIGLFCLFAAAESNARNDKGPDWHLRVKRNDFVNNYGYGLHGVGPTNIGVDSFGFYRDKFYNSGPPPLYTFDTYRNYYNEVSFHKNKYGNPVPSTFETLQQERFGPFYRGVWGYADHSPHWFG